MISQLTLRIVIGKKEHCIRKCGDKKSRLKQRLWTCETSVNTGDLCSASRFYVFTAMTFSFLKFRFILLKRIVNKQKNTVGLYWEVYFRKTKWIIKILVKETLNPAYWERLNQITQTLLRSFLFFFFAIFLPAKNKALTFIQTKVYIFSIRKKMTKSVL